MVGSRLSGSRLKSMMTWRLRAPLSSWARASLAHSALPAKAAHCPKQARRESKKGGMVVSLSGSRKEERKARHCRDALGK